MSDFETLRLTREDYARAEQFLPWNGAKLIRRSLVEPNWIGKSDRFWYNIDTPDGHEFVVVDAATKTRRPAFDHARLGATLTEASGVATEASALPFAVLALVDDDKAVQFDIGDVRWRCDLDTYVCAKVEKAPVAGEGELASPDGKWVAFSRDHNLFVRPMPSGDEVQLTTDGEPFYDYASAPENNTTAVTERLSGKKSPPLALWSPDSKRLVTHRLDQRKVPVLYLLQHAPPEGQRPVAHAYRMPFPGDEVPMQELVVLDVEARSVTRLAAPPMPNPDGIPALAVGQVWWSEDGARVYSIDHARGDKMLALRVSDAGTGSSRIILEESFVTHGDTNVLIAARPNVRVLADGSEAIWFSQRTGWGHLYLYDARTGALKNPITTGTLLVRHILHVDEAKRVIYFVGSGREAGRDPYYRRLYRVGLDGSGLEILTPEDADHHIYVSPTGACFVDNYSRVDLPTVSVLRSSSGEALTPLEEADVSLLEGTGWQSPERFCVKASDGVTDVYGVLYRPLGFDPEASYPVIDAIYPGPQTIRAAKFFGIEPALAFTALGFFVVTVDGRGTPFRSKAFQDASYGNMQNPGTLDDHVAAIRQMAAHVPQMDLERVGIFGHSGGGFSSTRAILMFPDFFKVAVSSAGNHDNRGYLAGWGEKYHGLLQDDNYDLQANPRLVANLKGKLLLACGDMDDNVHPALTLQVVDALIKANKDFDLLILPNRNHMFSIDSYFIRRLWDYFVRNLLGAEPPEGYVVGPADMGYLMNLRKRVML